VLKTIPKVVVEIGRRALRRSDNIRAGKTMIRAQLSERWRDLRYAENNAKVTCPHHEALLLVEAYTSNPAPSINQKAR